MEQFIEITTIDSRKNRINMVTVCAWCNRIKIPRKRASDFSSWVKLESIHPHAHENELYISHGICPHCKSSFNS